MAAIRQWLLGVTACALLASMAEQLCPEGNMRRIVRFTGGLLLLLAMLSPLVPARLAADPAQGGDAYREALTRRGSELEAEREKTLRRGIAEGLEAYIEDKAASMDAPVRAEVATEVRGGVPVPARVTLRGAYSEELAAYLAAELGIAKEDQTWIEDG